MTQSEKKNLPAAFDAAESDIGKPGSLWAAVALISDTKKATVSLVGECLVQSSWNPETKLCAVVSEEQYRDKTIMVSQILYWDDNMWRLSEREQTSDADTRWVGYHRLV